MEPYSDDEIADARTHLSCDDEYDRCHYHDVAHWLATVDALQSRLAAAEAGRDEAKRDHDKAFRGFQQVCFAMTGTSDVVSFMDALKPHSTAEEYARDLRVRCAAAEDERDDLRRYRKSWDKELRDAKEAARAAIDGRIAAEAEAERARGLLQRWFNDDAGESFEVYRALVDETRAHLASRPEGEVRDGR